MITTVEIDELVRFCAHPPHTVGCRRVAGGYIDPKRHPGMPAGFFSNESTVGGVVGVFGLHAQAAEGVNDWPACTVWGNENAVLNYNVVRVSRLWRVKCFAFGVAK
jgi:hypothetical protein